MDISSCRKWSYSLNCNKSVLVEQLLAAYPYKGPGPRMEPRHTFVNFVSQLLNQCDVLIVNSYSTPHKIILSTVKSEINLQLQIVSCVISSIEVRVYFSICEKLQGKFLFLFLLIPLYISIKRGIYSKL